MFKSLRLTVILLLVMGIFTPLSLHAMSRKVEIGMPFVHFDIEDIYRQRWVSTYLRGRPIIILTGHRYIRNEIAHWGAHFAQEYGLRGDVHLLWVVNLRRRPAGRAAIRREWYEFAPPIPLLLDWDGTIGRALRVNYNVPNIILIDAFGRLVMHEKHSFSPTVYNAVSARIKKLLSSPFVFGHPGYVVPQPIGQIAPHHSLPVFPPAGQASDSN